MIDLESLELHFLVKKHIELRILRLRLIKSLPYKSDILLNS